MRGAWQGQHVASQTPLGNSFIANKIAITYGTQSTKNETVVNNHVPFNIYCPPIHPELVLLVVTATATTTSVSNTPAQEPRRGSQ